MTIEVDEQDTVQGATLSWDLMDGITTSRRFIVKGIEGNRHEKTFKAATAPGVPRVGQAHPSILGSYVGTINVNAIGAGQAEVVVNYRPFNSEETPPDEEEDDGLISLSMSSTVQSVDTNFFIKGKEKNVMTTEYEWPAGNAPSGKNPDIQVGTVKKETASIVINRVRIEHEEPFQKALDYVGKVNSNTKFANGPAIRRGWLCSKIEAKYIQDSKWEVSYEFQLNIDTWDVTVVYVDPRTGKPPGDVTDQDGAVKKYQIYEEIDFNKLFD